MNIIYFGYDMFSDCLKKLLQNPQINILKIYSFPSDGYFDFHDEIKGLAVVKNIPFTTEKITSEELEFQFSQNKCQLAFSAGYQWRIPMENVANFRGINIHPSLLPCGRGPWPMPWVILKGLSKSGVTAHKLAPKIDEGDILLQKEFEVSKNETYASLEKKIQLAAAELTEQLFNNLEQLWKNAKPQGKGEYLPEPPDIERTVFRDTPKEKRELILRAFGEKYTIFIEKKEKEGN